MLSAPLNKESEGSGEGGENEKEEKEGGRGRKKERKGRKEGWKKTGIREAGSMEGKRKQSDSVSVTFTLLTCYHPLWRTIWT